MKKILFIVFALCATLVNAQTDMTAAQLKAAMSGIVYFNNDLNNPVGVMAANQGNCFWETGDQGYGPFLANCLSVSDEGNGQYATTYNNAYDDFLGLAITFTVENDVVTQFEVTSTCDSGKIPVGIYTPFNPGTLSNSCTKYTYVYLGGNTFIRFKSGTTTIAENLADGVPVMSKAILVENNHQYVPDDLLLSQYKVYGTEEMSSEEMMALREQGIRCIDKLVECTEATFIPESFIPDPDAEYVAVTYKEGGVTKKAYYKTSDVEKIEWLKGEDITE